MQLAQINGSFATGLTEHKTSAGFSAGKASRATPTLHDTPSSVQKPRPTVTMVEDGRVRRMQDNVSSDIDNMTELAKAAVELSLNVDQEHALGRGQVFRTALQT